MLKWYFWIQWVKFKSLQLSLSVSCSILKMRLLGNVNWHVWITLVACILFLLDSTAKDEGRYAPYLSSKGNSWEWLTASPSESCSAAIWPMATTCPPVLKDHRWKSVPFCAFLAKTTTTTTTTHHKDQILDVAVRVEMTDSPWRTRTNRWG